MSKEILKLMAEQQMNFDYQAYIDEELLQSKKQNRIANYLSNDEAKKEYQKFFDGFLKNNGDQMTNQTSEEQEKKYKEIISFEYMRRELIGKITNNTITKEDYSMLHQLDKSVAGYDVMGMMFWKMEKDTEKIKELEAARKIDAERIEKCEEIAERDGKNYSEALAKIAQLESVIKDMAEALIYYKEWACSSIQEKDYPHNKFGFVQYDVHIALINELEKHKHLIEEKGKCK